MIKKLIKIIGLIFLILLLTVLTQVGGIILLLFLLIWKKTLNKIERLKTARKIYRLGIKTGSFLIFYLLICLFIVPILARPFGRVPLPMNHANLQPLNIMTCLLNRHYVTEELLDATLSATEDLNTVYPGTVIAYLDANFPFIDAFPLLPHLSHDDGEKLDLAFLYTASENGEALNDAAPSFIGYGVFEEPFPSEQNQPDFCKNKGYWQYSILGSLVPQWNKSDYQFDIERTKALLQILTKEPAINKIFIEPHLKTRMNLHSDKIRYHGCGAVRHDDHIHIQL
ncbi:MAG: hypothetical protein GQ574_27685 [Crocinitomix sp.]|nr:hypothetical protein [Crocinitomix sp.]